VKQIVITPAAGKRLIGKGMVVHPQITAALKSATIVITGGTTNGYVAEEILASIGSKETFPRMHFFRGTTTPPGYTFPKIEDRYMGDVVIVKGVWQKGKTISEAAESLKEGDLILKGANAVDLNRRQAAILVGNPTGGTIQVALQASIGKRVGLIFPVGLEKRVYGDLNALATKVNSSGGTGLRLMPVHGQVFTEIDAIALLTGAGAELIGSGGVCGAEGACWLAISGTQEQEDRAEKLLKSIAAEPAFKL
jgi:hypothetical protein